VFQKPGMVYRLKRKCKYKQVYNQFLTRHKYSNVTTFYYGQNGKFLFVKKKLLQYILVLNSQMALFYIFNSAKWRLKAKGKKKEY